MRPLLLANTDVYGGPWVPTPAPPHRVVAHGLIPNEDEVAIMVRSAAPGTCLVVSVLRADNTVELDGNCRDFVRAVRRKSSGAEVSIWVS